jgi:hypothetical protein
MPVVEIPGLGNVEFPDSMSGDEINAAAQKVHAEQGGQSATMTKQAAPAAEPYDPSFMGTLGREVSGGMSDIGTGIKQMFSLPNQGEVNPMTGALQAVGGAGRVLTSPFTAAGAVGGEAVGETVRSATEGLGPNISAALGTAVGAPVNAAIQLYAAPQAIARAAPYVMKGAQSIARGLPGAQVTLREMGKKIIEALPSMMQPPRPAQELYAEVEKVNPPVMLSNFSKVAEGIAGREEALKKYGVSNTGIESVASKLSESTAATPVLNLPKELPFHEVQAVRQRIGERIGELRQSGGEGLGSYKQLFKSLSQELEATAATGAQSANSPAAREAFAKLKEANAAQNREFALGELDDVFNATLGRALEGKEYTSSSFAQALNKIRNLRRDDELFAKGLGAENLNKIESHLDELRKLKITPPPSGANFGSGAAYIRGAGTSGIAFGIGNYFGGPQLGATLGALSGGSALLLPPIISKIVQSDKGSKALVNVLKAEGTISPQKLSAIFAVIQGESAVKNNLAETVKSALQTPSTSIQEKIDAVMNRDTIFRNATAAEGLLNQ